jgi:DNA polymerase phi
MTILQVYNGDADAVSMLDELGFCYSKIWGHGNSEKRDISDASDASIALVEILLSFASKPSQLFRRMSEQVFSVFADQMTSDALQSLISVSPSYAFVPNWHLQSPQFQVLEAKENLAGQQELFEQHGDDEDEEMSDSVEMDEEDDDVEVLDVDKSEANTSEESGDPGESTSSEDSEESIEDEVDDELAAFDAKLAEALGAHRADQDSGTSDGDMNDDEMEALDEQISKVFRARSQVLNKKKDKKDAKENMVNFKNRVLDLLEIYVKKFHSDILALDLLLPLLRLTRSSTVKELSRKASTVLREYAKLCKGSALPSLDSSDPVWELLRAVHREATLGGPPAHASSCSQASLLLVKILVGHDTQAISQVVDIYTATRKEQLLNKKCHVQPSFFTEWNNWCVTASKQLKR